LREPLPFEMSVGEYLAQQHRRQRFVGDILERKENAREHR
jgi:hypothetical protein